MLSWFRELKEDFKAHRRGERRVAPRGATGRVYAKAGSVGPSTGEHNSAGRASATLSMKITRADGSIEFRQAPATIIGSI
jgi:hypothetical protein